MNSISWENSAFTVRQTGATSFRHQASGLRPIAPQIRGKRTKTLTICTLPTDMVRRSLVHSSAIFLLHQLFTPQLAFSSTQVRDNPLPNEVSQTADASNVVLEVFPQSEGSNQMKINEVLGTAPEGATVRLHPGLYREQVLVQRGVTLEALEGPGEVVLEHVTSNPYESTITVTSPSTSPVLLRGLTVRHSSPSVANNYGIILRGGRVTLQGCNLSSASGSALGMEGGNHVLQGCLISGAKNHGLALYGELFGDGGSADVMDCKVQKNGGNGILVRGPDVTLNLSSSSVTDNGAYGVRLADCEGIFMNNSISGNAKGVVASELGAYLDVVGSDNILQGKIVKL